MGYTVRTGLVIILAAMLGTGRAVAGERDEEAAFEMQVEAFAAGTNSIVDEGEVSTVAPMPVSGEIDLDKANAEIDHLKQVVAGLSEKLKRERRNSHYNMGYVYKVCRQYERAEQEFLKALAVDPDDPGVHYNLAILYDDDLKSRTKARWHYERFLELAPNDPGVSQVKEWLMSL